MFIIRRLNCIDVASGIVTLSKWPSGAQVKSSLSNCAPDGHLLRGTISDAASIEFNLQMMSIQCSKHVEDYNKHTENKACVYQVGHCLRFSIFYIQKYMVVYLN